MFWRSQKCLCQGEEGGKWSTRGEIDWRWYSFSASEWLRTDCLKSDSGMWLLRIFFRNKVSVARLWLGMLCKINSTHKSITFTSSFAMSVSHYNDRIRTVWSITFKKVLVRSLLNWIPDFKASVMVLPVNTIHTKDKWLSSFLSLYLHL